MDKPELMTKEEAQEYLRCSHQTLHRLMTKYGLPYFKVARRVLFRRAAVDAWLEERKHVSDVPGKLAKPRPKRRVA